MIVVKGDMGTEYGIKKIIFCCAGMSLLALHNIARSRRDFIQFVGNGGVIGRTHVKYCPFCGEKIDIIKEEECSKD